MTAAIVAGSARCLWDDLTLAEALAPRAHYVAVNTTGLLLPVLHHLVSLHPEILSPIRAIRRQLDWVTDRHGEQVMTHSRRPHPDVDRTWPQTWGGGTSSLLAVRIAIALEYDPILCVGIPLDSTGRVMDDPRKPVRWDWTGADGDPCRLAWQEAWQTMPGFKDRVRSCSGFTRELCGPPA
jgi:hypothetical protein